MELLKEQNQLTLDHNELFIENIGEFKRLLQLQAAELKLGNARTAIMDETMQKILTEVSSLQKQLEELIKEFKR